MGGTRSLGRCLLLLLLCAPAGAAERLEPITRLSFAEERAGQPLVGLGVRTAPAPHRTLLSFSLRSSSPTVPSLFALALYADRIGAKLALIKHKGIDLAIDQLPPSFVGALTSGFAKTLVLKVAASLTAEQVAAHILEPIRPRMGGGGGRELDTLQQILLDGCAAHASHGGVGTELAFGLRGPSIGVSVNGNGAGSISSYRLSRALLGCYFDEDSISPSFRQSCAHGFMAML